MKCSCSYAIQENNRQGSINTVKRVGNSPIPTAVSTTSVSQYNLQDSIVELRFG